MDNRGAIRGFIQDLFDAGRIGSALSEAARWGEIDLVEDLLDKDVPVDVRDENGGTALMSAASGGEVRIVRMLIERGADVNAFDESKGLTALMWCFLALHKERVYLSIAESLLSAGANVDLAAPDGRTAVDFARERKSKSLMELLENARKS